MAIETYLDNITSQHRDKPKFIAWLSAHLNKIDDAYNLINSLDSAFDIDNAIGVQQDTIGILVGVNRVLNFQPSGDISAKLDDDTYRLVQKAKIAKNQWDGTIPKIYELWNNMFNDLGLEIIDNENMTMTAVVTGAIDELKELLIANGYMVPKPVGVALNYVGKSPIQFNTLSSIVVCSSQTVTIDMEQPPLIPANLNVKSNIIVSGTMTNMIK